MPLSVIGKIHAYRPNTDLVVIDACGHCPHDETAGSDRSGECCRGWTVVWVKEIGRERTAAMKHTLSVLVEDESGTSRISGLLPGRGFNIDSSGPLAPPKAVGSPASRWWWREMSRPSSR